MELDELEALVVVDNETDTLSSIDPGVPQINEITRLAARTSASRVYEGHECKTVFDRLCCACHGFSLLLSGRRGRERRSVLFDVGPDPEIWLANARHLAIDLSAIECVFLSHWHFDHSGGFPGVIAAIGRARTAAGLAPPRIDLHPDRPDQRGVLIPGGAMIMLAPEPDIDAMARAGGEIVLHSDPHVLCGGFFFGSGAIERITGYESGFPGHYSFRGSAGAPDPLILDERFVAVRVRGRGVSVFSACSHAGIVNACLSAQAQFADAPIDAVVGGYHLAGKSMEPRIEPTVRDLEVRVRPRLVAPGHCTGWRAKARLAHAFAPGRYGPSVVGSMLHLSHPRL